MLKNIANKQYLLDVASMCKKKKFSPGFDGMSMDGANSYLFINADRVCRELLSGAYAPMPAIGFRTAKIHGGFRELSRLTALDTVIQTAINNALSPISENKFFDNSHAYRIGRGTQTAVECYVRLANSYSYVGKLDITSCFSNFDHSVILRQLNSFFDDEDLVELLMKFVKTPLFIDGEIVPMEKGILQGMPISPLICNIYMHRVDEFLREQNVEFIRYADDIVLFKNSFEEVDNILSSLTDLLQNEMKLTVNRKKTLIDSPSKIKFLGYKFVSDKRGIIAIETGSDIKPAYYDWHSEKPFNNRRRMNLLSDGILRQKDFSAILDTETVDSSIPIKSVDVVNIYSNVIFDTGSLNLFLKSGITVNVFDKTNNLIGSFVPNTSLKSPVVIHEQLNFYFDAPKRLYLAKEFVLASIHNSLLNIRYYNKHDQRQEYEQAIKKLQEIKHRIKTEENIEGLMLNEARAREIYYSCFDFFAKNKEFCFEKRTRKPPKNMLNSLISFGNTVLYELTATEMQKTPLDVRVGFLHATNTRKKSLNLDMAEIFKPLLVDRTIFSLINKGSLNYKHFTFYESGAVYLNTEGKRIFLSAFYEKLNDTITVKEAKISYDGILKNEIRKLIRHFKGTEKYVAFRQVR